MLSAWSVAMSPRSYDFLEALGIFTLGFIGVSLVAYLIVGVPSIVYALLMEYVINAHVKTAARVITLSALFGALTGAGVSVLLLVKPDPLFSTALTIIGGTVGCSMGYVLRRMYTKAADSALRPTHEARN